MWGQSGGMAEGHGPPSSEAPPPPSPPPLFWSPPPAPAPPPPQRPSSPQRTRPAVGRPFIRRFRREDRFDFCTICQETFTSGELINVLPCRHVFHIICIGEWLSGYRHSCPLCQQWTLPARSHSRSRHHSWRRHRHRRWRQHRRRRQHRSEGERQDGRGEAADPQPIRRHRRRSEFWVRPITVQTNH